MGGAAAAARMNASWQSADARITDIMNTDYMGRFFDATSARAVQNALADVEEKAGAAGKALKEAGQAGDAAWRKLAREAERAAERTLDFWKGVGRGFINDLKQGLEEGKGLWRSLGDAAVGALQRIADKALEIASDRLITSLLGNLLGGSFLSPRASGAIGAGFAGLYANGAAFSGGNVIPFATGGVVSSPTTFPMSGGRTGLMGEAGPEAIMPLKRGPDGRLGVSAANGNGSGGGSKVEVDVAVRTFMDDNGNWQAKVEEISTRQAGAVVRENNRGSYQRFLSNMGSARKRNAI